ncbi:Cyclin-dependent kinase 4 [Geodia barretti]|uniref:cyclin-dependent kinase n=1 Tax=Geodia barretti TaxID=519541 RepID=A0AA35VR68_GEOBA|nr:Cyclin-dependent kinase 4 [Geodia barretti]
MLGEQLEAREELVETEDDREAMNLEERFEILDNLGSGAYATVYRARDRSRGGEVVALKKVYVREDREIGIPQFIMREVANLKRLSTPGHRKDPHIVRLLDVQSAEGRYRNEQIFYLVFEHMDQDLDQFIRACPSPGMNETIIRDFLAQILDGVDWMHVNNIVHRDLKPQNILVSCDGKKLKIADLGLSRSIGSNVVLSTQVVTQWYRAPEVLLHSSYSKPVDVWSVGCIFAEMIRGRPLFAARRKGEKHQLEEIFSIIGTPTTAQWPVESSITVDQFVQFKAKPWLQLLPEASDDAQDLLSQMLQFQPLQRVSTKDSLHHPYITSKASQDEVEEEEEEEERRVTRHQTPPKTAHTPPTRVLIWTSPTLLIPESSQTQPPPPVLHSRGGRGQV